MKKLFIILFMVLALILAGCQASNGDEIPVENNHQPGTQPTSDSSAPTDPAPTDTDPTEPPPTESVPPEPEDPTKLNAALEQEIIDAYRDIYIGNDQDASVSVRYMGTYNGAVVAFMDCTARTYRGGNDYISFGGYLFHYDSEQRPRVYRDGSFSTLEVAYYDGWITDDDLGLIHRWYCDAYAPVPTEPSPDGSAALDSNLAQEIIDAYLALYAKPDDQDASASLRTYGLFDGAAVTYVDCSLFAYPGIETEIVVGEYVFMYGSSQQLEVYKDGEFLDLDDAYTQGWISDESLARVYDLFTNGRS